MDDMTRYLTLLGLFYWNLCVQEGMRWSEFTRHEKYRRLRYRQEKKWAVDDNGKMIRELEEMLWAVPNQETMTA